MNEKPTTNITETLSRASMEGNVYMPQNGLYIAVNTAERCLTQPNPQEAVMALISPIPLDEALEQRTKKANAQHALHGIEKELSMDDVRYVLANSNIITLDLIASMLGKKNMSWGNPNDFNSVGVWVSEDALLSAKEIVAELMPEKARLMLELLRVVKEIINSSFVKEMLAKRKSLYKDWSIKPREEQNILQNRIDQLNGDILKEVDEALNILHEHGEGEDERMSIELKSELEIYLKRLINVN